MPASLSITDEQITTALRTFLVSILSDAVEVVLAQGNRVPPPRGSFVEMQVAMRPSLDSGQVVYAIAASVSTAAIRQAAMVTVQLDAFGDDASENVQVIAATFRTPYACEAFRASALDVTPLYAGEPRQLQFVNDSSQYEERWSLDVVLQVNPVITLPQDLATHVGVTLATPH